MFFNVISGRRVKPEKFPLNMAMLGIPWSELSGKYKKLIKQYLLLFSAIIF
jgi:hypothetical protein